MLRPRPLLLGEPSGPDVALLGWPTRRRTGGRVLCGSAGDVAIVSIRSTFVSRPGSVAGVAPDDGADTFPSESGLEKFRLQAVDDLEPSHLPSGAEQLEKDPVERERG